MLDDQPLWQCADFRRWGKGVRIRDFMKGCDEALEQVA